MTGEVLKGRATFAPASGADGYTWIFRLEDESAHVLVVQVEMHPAEFAQLMAHTHAKVEYGVGRPELWGTELEVEAVAVAGLAHGPLSEWPVQFAAAVAAVEVDGWRVDVDSGPNMHRWNDDGTYRVTRRRYLRDGEPVIP